MIAAGKRDDATSDFLRAHGQNGVGGSANFERAGLLKIVALEKQVGSGDRIERRGSQYRRAMDARGNTRMRRYDSGPIRRASRRCHGVFFGGAAGHGFHYASRKAER